MTNIFPWTILKLLLSSNLKKKENSFQLRNKDHGVQFNEQIV